MATADEIRAELARRKSSTQAPTQTQPQTPTREAIVAELESRGFTQQPQATPTPERQGLIAKLDKALLSIPGVPTLAELASGANRSVMDFVDFIGPDAVNGLLQMAGTDARMPGMRDIPNLRAEKGDFGGPGLATDIASTVGSVIPAAMGGGAAIRQGAQMLSPLTQHSESAIAGLLRQTGATTPAADLGYATASGVGGAVGKDLGGSSGEMAGFFLAPLSVAGATAGFKGLLSKAENIAKLTSSLSSMSDEGAARLLADAMVREGMSPDDVVKQLQSLGPDAIPADVTNTFGRLLRAAANQIPRIQGRASSVLNARQSGQAGRLASSIDSSLGVPGLNVDDEIVRLNAALTPEIRKLYQEAGASALPLSPRLRGLLEGDTSLGKAFKAAQGRVADKRAAGDTITHFDVIDATKQQLDDQIGRALREGENNTARDLLRLKNLMIEEADKAIPGYQKARAAFAGKVALESAAEQGALFFKMKPREVADFVKGMGESELRMFRLGAKQAVLDLMDTIPVGSDSARRLFGKNGDVAKLQSLFPDEKSFNAFSMALEREATFTATRRTAQSNSTTIAQAADARNAASPLGVAQALAGDPRAVASEIGNLVSGLSRQKGSQAYLASLERVGDILLDSGLDPEFLRNLLRQGDTPRLRALLTRTITKPQAMTQAATTGTLSEMSQ